MTITDLLKAGLEQYQRGNLEGAEKKFRQVILVDNRNIHGLNLLGMICVNTGRHEEAVQLITDALKISPIDAQAQGNLGLAYQRMGNLKLAESCFRKSIELGGKNRTIFNSLGNVLRESGRASEAIQVYESTLKVDGNYAECWTNLSQALVELGEFGDAFKAVSRALQIDPSLAEAHNQMAEIYRNIFKYDLAISAYKKSLELRPTLYESMLGLATVYRESEDVGAALEVLNRLIALEPRHAKAHAALGILKEQVGDTVAAADCFKKSIQLAPDAVSPLYHLSQIKGRIISQDEILAMERLQKMTDLSSKDRSHVHFGLGEAYDQQGQTDKAFNAWLIANQDKAESYPYDLDKRTSYQASTIAFSKALRARLVEPPAENIRQLVFIVGMQRSGTSLTDQILASNTQVSSLGEIGYADEMAVQVKELTGKHYPQGLSGLSQEDISLLRESFLGKISQRYSAAPVLIDKTPMNFQYLGLLAEVFPSAKFIHCSRNPMDNCFSIFKLAFTDDQDYAHGLKSLGDHYRLYKGLMDQWKKLYPQRILDVRYEDTVSNIQEQCVRLVEFLGLAFEPEMLEFYSTERLVRTPSASQVRKPIYKSSVQAWKKYERHLQPLAEALGDELRD